MPPLEAKLHLLRVTGKPPESTGCRDTEGFLRKDHPGHIGSGQEEHVLFRIYLNGIGYRRLYVGMVRGP